MLIPSANDVPAHELRPGTLVRFRGMVQDTFNPDYFPQAVHETLPTGEVVAHNMWFRDNVVVHSPDSQTQHEGLVQRQTVFCVPVPAETEWAKAKYAAAGSAVRAALPVAAPADAAARSKRRRHDDEDDEDDAVEGGEPAGDMDAPVQAAMQTDDTAANAPADALLSKKARRTHGSTPELTPALAAAMHQPWERNFPIPTETSSAMIVKVK